jgi:predicted lactoylglutathione lyase
MRLPLPHPVPELPVTDLQAAISAYAQRMGFNVDWTYEDALAGISKDAARIFLRRRTPQEAEQAYSVTIWLNVTSAADVDQLYAEWKDQGVPMQSELHTAPYNLREFTAHDLDGNRFRVFHDLGQEPTRR